MVTRPVIGIYVYIDMCLILTIIIPNEVGFVGFPLNFSQIWFCQESGLCGVRVQSLRRFHAEPDHGKDGSLVPSFPLVTLDSAGGG